MHNNNATDNAIRLITRITTIRLISCITSIRCAVENRPTQHNDSSMCSPTENLQRNPSRTPTHQRTSTYITKLNTHTHTHTHTHTPLTHSYQARTKTLLFLAQPKIYPQPSREEKIISDGFYYSSPLCAPCFLQMPQIIIPARPLPKKIL